MIVADAQGEAWEDGVHILDVGTYKNRFQRMIRSTKNVCKEAININADIYVLHDPELIPSGLRLRRMGRKVVFDSHEDIPTQIRGKPYLGALSGPCLAHTFQAYEHYACCRFDGIVAVTPLIRDKFKKMNARCVDINNYPILDEFPASLTWTDKAIEVCYVGNVSAMRGIRELVEACTLLRTPTTVALAGAFESSALADEVARHPGWRRIRALGHIDRTGVSETMARSMAGIVPLHPQANYLESLPVKMFEYMAAGIPVIASDFPLWRRIIDDSACGICVDPLNPAAIAAAIDHLVLHPEQARQMGMRGRRAVTEKYNWRTESTKMLNFYSSL